MRQLGLAATERPNSLHPLAHPQQTQPRPLALPPRQIPWEFPASSTLSASKLGTPLPSGPCPCWFSRRGNQRLVQPRQNGTQTRTGQNGSQAAAPDSITTYGLCSGQQCLSKTPSCLHPCSRRRVPGPSGQRWPQKDQKPGAGGQGQHGGQGSRWAGGLGLLLPLSLGLHPSGPGWPGYPQIPSFTRGRGNQLRVQTSGRKGLWPSYVALGQGLGGPELTWALYPSAVSSEHPGKLAWPAWFPEAAELLLAL